MVSKAMDIPLYRVIHKSLREFRPLRYSSRDGHAEGKHVNRGRDNTSFCPTLQVLDISTLGDAADVNHVIKFLPHTLHVCGRNQSVAQVTVCSQINTKHIHTVQAERTSVIHLCINMLWASNNLLFGRFRKIAKGDYQFRHVYQFVRAEQLGSNWKNFQ